MKKQNMKEWDDKPEYIQIVDCGKAGFAVWNFPHTHTFYPTHSDDFDEMVREAMYNGYKPLCSFKNRFIMRSEY